MVSCTTVMECESYRESGMKALSGSNGPNLEQVTDVHSVDKLGDPHLFQTSSADGFVRTWDLRTPMSVESFSSQNQRPIYSCSCDGTRVAGGAGEQLVLWDRRTRKTMEVFRDTHALDIVQLQFNNSHTDVLVSASEDGNLAVFDFSSLIDEEDSFVGALSISTSVARLGFFGTDDENLWLSSGTESLHWWGWKESCDPTISAAAGVTAESLTPRDLLRIGANPSDYIIRCYYDDSESTMYCISGSNEGAIAVYPCHAAQPSIVFGSHPAEVLQPGVNGHKDVVRDAIVIPHPSGHAIVSGGEDGRLCLWTVNARTNAFPDAASVERPARNRFAPY